MALGRVDLSDQYELLNAVDHAALAMRAEPGIPHPHFVAITLAEVPMAAPVCPLFLAKSPVTGAFYLAAMFGFQPDALLVEGAADWTAAFTPLELQRQGFFTSGESIAIDPAHPRFAQGANIALFENDKTPSAALRKIQAVLGQLVAGMAATSTFLDRINGLNLVEPVNIDLAFDDGSRLTLDGLYTISLDRIDDLDDQEIVRLMRDGHLQPALAIAGSLQQINVLARRRNLGFAG